MNEYIINVSQIEDLQTTKNLSDLEQIFTRAHSMVVQGGTVVLERQNPDGSTYQFDQITTEPDLKNYRESVFRYL